MGEEALSASTLTQFRAVFLGAPGAGKGTQAHNLWVDKQVLHISTGDLLRAQVSSGSELGEQAKAFMDAGKLVPDQVMVSMVEDRLAQPDAIRSWILDGFPRTVPQAESLDRGLSVASQSAPSPNNPARGLSHVVYFPVPEQVLIKRLSGRWSCQGCGAIWNTFFRVPREAGICDTCRGSLQQRGDDRPEAVEKRLEVYLSETEPLLEHYRSQGKLVEVDADRSPDLIYQELITVLEREL